MSLDTGFKLIRKLKGGTMMMLDVAKIKAAIECLPEKDYFLLRKWFWEKDWQRWGRQIEADSGVGRLDFLVKEAFDEKDQGQLEEL
jgi:hypothetical protein